MKEDVKGKNQSCQNLNKAGLTKKKKARQLLERWKPPGQGWVKVNVDGDFNQETGRAGITIIMRDSTGMVIFVLGKPLLMG
jgi:hypothetical protein